jgi:hypothetical protein
MPILVPYSFPELRVQLGQISHSPPCEKAERLMDGVAKGGAGEREEFPEKEDFPFSIHHFSFFIWMSASFVWFRGPFFFRGWLWSQAMSRRYTGRTEVCREKNENGREQADHSEPSYLFICSDRRYRR